MRKLFTLLIPMFFLFVNVGYAQVTYDGNDNTGFGGAVGESSLSINDNGTTITITFTKGSGNFNDYMVMYIDNGSDGRELIDSDVNDNGDRNRGAISNFGSSSITLPPGFEATHGIAISTSFGGLWGIPNSGTIGDDGLNYIGEVGNPASNTSSSFTFSFDWSEIGLSSTDDFSFVITYGNPTNNGNNEMFSSDEAYGDGISSGNPGTGAMTYDTYFEYPSGNEGGIATTASSGDWSNTATWTNGNVPLTGDQVEIGHDVTLNQNATVSSITINNGSTFTASDGTNTYKLSIQVGGSLTNNGTFTASDGTVSFDGSGLVDGSSATTFNDVEIAGGVVLNGNSTIGNKLTINSGGYLSQTAGGSGITDESDIPNYSSGATLAFTGTFDVNSLASGWGVTSASKIPEVVNVEGTGVLTLSVARDMEGEMTVESEATLNTNGNLTIKSDATGTGSLIVEGTATGDITSERYIGGYNDTPGDGWHLLSSPVSNQAIDGTNFEPTDGTDDFFEWSESTYMWINHDGGGFTSFDEGKGYLVAYESTETHEYTGTPNTADETETLTNTAGQGEGWNLLGNPFQSALKWDDGNWTLGDVQATAKIYDENDGNYDDIQNGGVDIIPANQGFFVKTTSAGSLTIPKAARVHDGTTFYKNTRASGGFLKLRIEAEENTFADEFTVWSNEGASDGYDSYDSEKFYGNAEAPQFYGVVNGENYSTVSYQPAAIEDSRMVDLSLDAPEGEYSVSINTNTLASGTEIYIEDLLTGEFINMNETESFTVNVSESDPNERFVLHLNSTSVSNETLAEENSVKIYASNHQLYIDSENMLDDGKVTVYNTVGQVVAKEEMNGNTLSLNINERGTYIVTVRSDEGVSTRKVVIR